MKKVISACIFLLGAASCQKEISDLNVPDKEIVVMIKYPESETIIDANNIASLAYNFEISISTGKQALYVSNEAIRSDTILDNRSAFCFYLMTRKPNETLEWIAADGAVEISKVTAEGLNLDAQNRYLLGVNSKAVFKFRVRYTPQILGNEYKFILPYMKYAIVLGNGVIRELPRNSFQTQFTKIE